MLSNMFVYFEDFCCSKSFFCFISSFLISDSSVFSISLFSFFGATLSDTGSFANMVLDLPGNSSFDYETYQYTKARYILVWKNIRLYDPSGSLLAGSAQPEGPVHERYINDIDLDTKPEGQIPIYFLRSDLINVNTFCDGRTSVGIFGMGFINPETNKGSWYSSRFTSTNITPSCPGNMPYEVNQ